MSGSAAETTPTLAGFQAFVTNAVQIPASVPAGKLALFRIRLQRGDLDRE